MTASECSWPQTHCGQLPPSQGQLFRIRFGYCLSLTWIEEVKVCTHPVFTLVWVLVCHDMSKDLSRKEKLEFAENLGVTYRCDFEEVWLIFDHVFKFENGVVLWSRRVLLMVYQLGMKNVLTLLNRPFERNSATDFATVGFSATHKATLLFIFKFYELTPISPIPI